MLDMMIRPVCCGSWACPRCGPRLGKVLQKRLRDRLVGERVLLLTLTLDPSRFEGKPLEGYRFSRRNRSLPRFMEVFCARHGIDKRASYFWKMELQQSGWCHWHVLLIVRDDFDVELWDAASDWRLGHAKAEVCRRLDYVCKYASKGGCHSEDTVRASGLPARGVRWTGASRGFWGTSRSEKSEVPEVQRERDRDVEFEESLNYEAAENHVVRLETCGSRTRVSIMELADVHGELAHVFVGDIVFPFGLPDVMAAVEHVTGCHFDEPDVSLTDAEWDALLDQLGFDEWDIGYGERGKIKGLLRDHGRSCPGFEDVPF